MERKLNTKITEMLGIEYPILLGAMEWMSTAELAAAVSNAGGLGVLSTVAFKDVGQLRAEIKKVKALTDKPFAVNMSIIPDLTVMDYDEIIDVCAEEGVRVMETSAYAPGKYIGHMKAVGMKVIHKCTTVKHALKAESIGCDAVIVDGCEAAGRIGETDIGSMILWPAAVDALSIPVIGCGGVADGRALASALMMGCEGVTVGTRFFLSEESPASRKLKEFLVSNIDEAGTILVYRRHASTCRLVNVGLAKKLREMELGGASYQEMRSNMGPDAKMQAFFEGNLDKGTTSVGQCIGLIHEVLPVKQIVDSMMRQCIDCIDKYA